MKAQVKDVRIGHPISVNGTELIRGTASDDGFVYCPFRYNNRRGIWLGPTREVQLVAVQADLFDEKEVRS